jgi:hypothetical protein
MPESRPKKPPETQAQKEKFLSELVLLEDRLEALRIQYEQYFIDVITLIPMKLHQEVKTLIRELLKAPFKNSQTRYKLKTLINRYQTYSTYWERVIREREDGTYHRDLFKVNFRDELKEVRRKERSVVGKTDERVKQLYSAYEQALQSVGKNTDNLNYDRFRKQLVEQAKTLQKEHGSRKLQYAIVVSEGKVKIRATPKN